MAIVDTTFATQNALCSAYATRCAYGSLHTADIPTSGNELTGTGYSRGVITWGSPASGVITGTFTYTLPTAGGSPKGCGLWTASTAGALADAQYNTADVTYPGAGTAFVTITYTA